MGESPNNIVTKKIFKKKYKTGLNAFLIDVKSVKIMTLRTKKNIMCRNVVH